MSDGNSALPAVATNRRRIKKKGTVVFPDSLFHELPESWHYVTVDTVADVL